MALPKQKKDESDADYAARVEVAKEAHRQSCRKYRDAHREAVRERQRASYHANKESKGEAQREAKKASDRKRYQANKEAIAKAQREKREARNLANAKGLPLQANYRRAHRPRMLTRLIIKVAEDFCRNYGFPLERKLDADVLKHAAETIRNSTELDGAANPWYGTDFLCPAVVDAKDWARGISNRWRNKV